MEETRTVVQPALRRRKPRTVTLQPGSWIYVCPCGFPYQVMRLRHVNTKVGTYCFNCHQEIGKYYKVMEERLEFSINPNGVLNCQCFPLLRLHNPIKNCVGAVKQIYLKGVWRGNAKVIAIERMRMDGITPVLSHLAAGISPEEFRQKLRSQCRNRPGINWETQELDYLVLEYIWDSREPKLFQEL